MKKQKGITLVALVITIVILLILAGVVISQLTGNENIMKGAEKAVGDYNSKQQMQEVLINTVEGYLYEYMPQPKAELEKLTEFQETTITAEDANGNQVTVPGGFKVRTDLATTVQQGIVIEDEIGNQFVWIPIGEVVKDDGSKIEIEFGRYDNGVIQQSADNYEEIVEIAKGYYNTVYELSTFREANFSNSNAIGCTSYNLGEFITKTKENNGYYIAKYAGNLADTTGITSGYTEGVPAVTNQVPTFMGETPTRGIRQGDAATACRNVYKENEFVASDLMNSYATGTVAKYIELCEQNINYFNMGYPAKEWTTESESRNGKEYAIIYSSGGFGGRAGSEGKSSDYEIGFRAVLYVK